MPTITSKKICAKHGFYKGDKCPHCKQYQNKAYDKFQRSKERKKIYNSKRWKEVRKKALIRDNFLCVECRKNDKLVKADEVDHIKELQDNMELAYELDNLQCLCYSCHRKKTEKEREERVNGDRLLVR